MRDERRSAYSHRPGEEAGGRLLNRARGAAVAAGLALLLAACQGAPGSSGGATKNLEVLSWWTSGSETAALNVLFDDFRKTNPGVNVANAAAAGGGGSKPPDAPATRPQDNNPTGVRQTPPARPLR